jgi:hypothetical protein
MEDSPTEAILDDNYISYDERVRAEASLCLGWRCPVCGRGLAPDVKECSCVPKKDILDHIDEFFAEA